MKKNQSPKFSIWMLLTSRLLTLILSFSFIFDRNFKAFAQSQANLKPKTEVTATTGKEDQKEETFMNKLGDTAKETGKQIAVDTAKSIAIGVAASIARQAVEASSTFGAGAAIGAAKKAAVVAKHAKDAAQAAQTIAKLKDFEKDNQKMLIIAIVLGLVGITAIVACKKQGNSIPSPSFYLWTVGSIAFMISEIVHFIKFKSVSKKIAQKEFADDSKQQVQALEQQKALLEQALQTTKGKKTWTQILLAAFAVATVAALAELLIEIMTEGIEVTFTMKCGKDKGGDDKKADSETKTETAQGETKKGLDFKQIGKDAGNKAINNFSNTTSNHFGGKIGKAAGNGIADKAGFKKEKKEAEKVEEKKPEEVRAPGAVDKTNGTEENNDAEDSENTETTEEEEEDTVSLLNWKKENQVLVSEYEINHLKKSLILDLHHLTLIKEFSSPNNDLLIENLAQAQSDLDGYFIFDEWNRARNGHVSSVSIDRYYKMQELDLIPGKNSLSPSIGLKDSLILSLQFIKDNALIANTMAEGGGGAAKAGKAAAKIIINILAGIAENAITTTGETLIEREAEGRENQINEKYEEKEKELEAKEEELSKEIEAEEKRVEDIDAKIEAIEEKKQEKIEIAAEEKEARAEEEAEKKSEAEDEANEEKESDEDSETEEEEEEETEEESETEIDESVDTSQEDEEIRKLEQEKALIEKNKQEKENKNFDNERTELENQQAKDEAANEKKGAIIEKAIDKGSEYLDDGASFVGDGIRDGLGGLVDGKKKNKDKTGTSNESNASAENKPSENNPSGVQDGVKNKTNENKGKLKAKIQEMWDKLMALYNKLFAKPATRSAMGAANTLIVGLILKEINKQIKELEKNIAQLDQMIAELKALEGQKVAGGKSAKEISEAKDYRPDLNSSSIAGGAGYSGASGSPFAGLNGVCLSGQGADMEIGSCGCQKTNSCTNFEQHKIEGKYFPSSVSVGQNSIYGIAHKMTNGDYKGATLSGMDFAKNAHSLLKQKNAMQAKINDVLKSKGLAPMNFNKQAAAVMQSTMKTYDDSGVAEAYDQVHGSGRTRSTSSELDKLEKKDPYTVFSTPTESSSTKPSPKGVDFSLEEEVEEEREIASAPEKVAGLEEYDVAVQDIQDRPTTSIFDIIHARYIKSGYPILLKKNVVEEDVRNKSSGR